MKRADWFKFYVDSLNDIKFKKLVSHSPEQHSYYVHLWLLMMNESAKGGGVIDCEPDDWHIMFDAITAQVADPQVQDMIYDMENVGLIQISEGQIKLKNWEKYQAEALSTGRVREHRLNKELEEKVTKVITEFNQLAGSRYSIKTEGTRELIRGRFNEGRTHEEMIAVIKDRIKKWSKDPRMKDYIRPSTIFRPGNFDNYLNEIPAQHVEAANKGELLRVRNLYGVVREVTQEEFNQAAKGFYSIIED